MDIIHSLIPTSYPQHVISGFLNILNLGYLYLISESSWALIQNDPIRLPESLITKRYIDTRIGAFGIADSSGAAFFK